MARGETHGPAGDAARRALPRRRRPREPLRRDGPACRAPPGRAAPLHRDRPRLRADPDRGGRGVVAELPRRATTSSSPTARTSAPPTPPCRSCASRGRRRGRPSCPTCGRAPTSPTRRSSRPSPPGRTRARTSASAATTYRWSKHVNFLRFLDLPQHTPTRLRLAMESRRRGGGRAPRGPRVGSRRLRGRSRATSRRTVASCSARAASSRSRRTSTCGRAAGGSATGASATSAAGRPVVTQETGFSKLIPTGEGLFAFATREEIVDAFARDRARTTRGTGRRRAASPRSTSGRSRCSRRLLADAGLG